MPAIGGMSGEGCVFNRWPGGEGGVGEPDDMGVQIVSLEAFLQIHFQF